VKKVISLCILCVIMLSLMLFTGSVSIAQNSINQKLFYISTGECLHHNEHIAFLGPCSTASNWELLRSDDGNAALIRNVEDGECLEEVVNNQIRMRACDTSNQNQYFIFGSLIRDMKVILRPADNSGVCKDMGIGGYDGNRAHLFDLPHCYTPTHTWLYGDY